MSDIKSYTTHNFDAVNDQIHQISKRERARTFAYRLQSLRTIFFYAAGIALIICLLMLCFSWAHRIINAPYPEKEVQIVKPEIIEKEVLKVVQVPVEKSILESVDNTYKGPTATKSTITNNNTSPNISVVTNFNTFKTAQSPELASYGLSEVTTGWKYISSEDKYPNLQYCYINKDTGGATSLKADLAGITQDGEYISYIDSKLARELSITQTVLKQAEKYCQWAGTP